MKMAKRMAELLNAPDEQLSPDELRARTGFMEVARDRTLALLADSPNDPTIQLMIRAYVLGFHDVMDIMEGDEA